MATVKVNEIPTPKPPATYDILDLTEDEMELIVNLIGRCGGTMAFILYGGLPDQKYDADYFSSPVFLGRPANGK